MSATAACIFGCEGPALGDAERAFLAETAPWGFILFARNVETPDQLRRLTGDLRDAVGRDAPIFVDQEGGRVQRLRAPFCGRSLLFRKPPGRRPPWPCTCAPA